MTPKQEQLLRTRLPLALLALAVLLYALYFSALTLQRYYAFEARALDLGNLNQAIWNTAHGNWFRMTNQEAGVVTRLAMHAEPILLLLAPLYRLWPTVEFLLVLQAVVVALGALPLFALARHRQLGDWLGLLFAVAFLLNPAVQAANWLEFHPVTLAPTFLMAAFYCLVTGRTGWFALFAALAAGCKEEIGLLVFMLGLYGWLAVKRPRLGLITMLLGLGWSLLAVLGVQTFFAGGNIHWGRYAYLGETIPDKLLALLTRPGLIWAQLQQAQGLRYGFELLLPVGFTALLAPEVLLLALPSLAINLLADYAPMHQVTTLMYAAPVVPFVMLASVMGVARAQEWAVGLGTGTRRREEREAAQSEGAAGLAGQRRQRTVRWTAAGLVLTGVLVSQRLYGYLPGSGHYLALTVTDHHRRAAELIRQIPPDARVAAQDRLNPHVSGRETLYIYPRVEDADTVFVDVTGPAWPQHPNELYQSVNELLAGEFGVAAADDGYLLLRKGAAAKAVPPAFYTAWQQPPAPTNLDAPSQATNVVFGDQIALRDYTVTTDRYGELVVQMTWEATQPISQPLYFNVAYLDAELNVLHDSQFYQPVGSLWYPASLWPPGERVYLQTLPWRLAEETFVLAVGVYTDAAGWNSGARLPVTQVEPVAPLLEGGQLVRLGGFTQTDGGAWAPQSPVSALPNNPLAATFGESIQLTGSSLPAQAQAGATVPFTLFWQGTAPPAGDYNSFVHLLDEAGNKVAQLDWTPHDAISKLPTQAWPVGWPVQDTQQLALPPGLPPGVYTLIAGLYDWQSGARLPVTGQDGAPGDVATVGKIMVR